MALALLKLSLVKVLEVLFQLRSILAGFHSLSLMMIVSINALSSLKFILCMNVEIFFIIISNALLIASEGKRVMYTVKVRKIGITSLTYNVSLAIQALTSSASNHAILIIALP